MSEHIAGGCLCGAVRYRLDEVPRECAFCHCRSCRKSSGAAFVPWGTVDLESFHLTLEKLSIAKTSEGVERGFCGLCGSTITYWNIGRPAEIDITLVSLDDETLARPRTHIWTEDKLPWVTISDGLPQYRKVDGFA